MTVAILGCGLIGTRRAKAFGFSRLNACADVNLDRANELAGQAANCIATSDWRKAVAAPGVQIVVAATPHNLLAEITRTTLDAGKHVLVEKPGARAAHEIRDPQTAKGPVARVGFNLRYHRAFRKARELVDAGELGPLMFLRIRYGHGGRLSYEKEWRARPELSGGGELIDQGVHAIDLVCWFLGEFKEVDGFAHTYFWDMPVDDNAFLRLRTASRQCAFIHVSCTKWKNTFSFELYGRTGKHQVDGLGGSYGVERLTFQRMLPQMGPPETTAWEYPMADDSWEMETAEFLEDIHLGRKPASGLAAALEIVENIYRKSSFDHHA